MLATQRFFGEDAQGNQVQHVTLENDNGLQVQLLSYGAIVQSIQLSSKRYQSGNLVLSHATLEAYLNDKVFLGAVIGRYCNRIRNGSFELDSRLVNVTRNKAGYHLHGGLNGFHRQHWHIASLSDLPHPSVEFCRVSPHGEEGYPGTVMCSVKYTLTEQNGVAIDYHATTDQATVINMTNHSYFNLHGDGESNVQDHELQIYADHFLPIDKDLLPLGELTLVDNTPFDLRKAVSVGRLLNTSDVQLDIADGLDHTFALQHRGEGRLELAAILSCQSTGMKMKLFTTQPAVQCYSGNALKEGGFSRHSGLCLETQHFPDSPNNSHFPPTLLLPDDEYRHTTMYEFSHA